LAIEKFDLIFQVVGAVQLIMAGWAIYKMIMIRYAPNLDDRWNDNEIVYWFPPGKMYTGALLLKSDIIFVTFIYLYMLFFSNAYYCFPNFRF